MINSTYKKANRLFYTLVLVCLVQLGWAQIYPVQVNSNVIPPYLSSVAKYSTTTDQKYLVNIFTSDLNVVNRQVRLKLYIQGNGIQAQSTPVVVGAAPLFINGGESLQLNNLDLAPYFELQNLQGINPLQYSGVLPQGNYSFCIEVYDFITNQPISQKSCTFFYFIYNDPPFLNLPFNHEVIHFQDPQNIIFTWTPRHINATNIEYEFVLIELLDNQAPSNYAFMVGAPIWQTITNNTILHYDFTLPQLTLGKKYAWRVKALSQPGFGEDAVFNNNGYSEIFDFVYAGNCNAPEFVIAQSVSARQAKIMWQNNPNHLSYIVQYRKLGTEIWFNAPVANNEAQLFDLEPSTTYEFQVGGTCLGDVTTFSAINQFTQPETNVAVIDCGIAPTIDLANVTLYSEALAEDMVFMAADFAVHINEIEGVGTYTGKGWTRLPYLSNIKIAVEFENIKLNSELQLVDGEVRAQYDPEWSNILDVNEVIDVVENVLDNFQESNDTHNHTVNYVIGDVSNIVVEDGKIMVTNPDTGLVSNIFDFDQGETTTITDSEGSVYTVDPNGNVSFQGQGVGIANASNTENLNSKGEVIALSNVGAKVVFSRNDQSVAFDDSSANYSGAPNKLAAEYKTIKDGSGNDYPFYYKGIINKEDGKVSYDYVTAQITITDTLIKAKNIVFNVKGIKVNAIDSTTVGNVVTKTLKVPAFTTEGENELLALVKTDSLKQKVVGAMMVVPIKDIGTVNVNLVPVNGATITQADIQEIKNIYGGAGVTLNITTLPAHTDGITTLECGTSGWIANYTNEQNAFIDRFKATTTINNNAYYLFVTKNITPSRPLSGFMPLHRQFGFVFTGQTGTGEIKQTNGSGLATVIAHELGHGAFELEHPWEKYDYDKNAYATNWLMDYANGTKLPYRHWQQISHPKTKLYLFQSDESGQGTSISGIPYGFENSNGTFTFLTVDGNYLTLPSNIKNIDFITGLANFENQIKYPTGAIFGFELNNKKYKAKIEHNQINNTITTNDFSFSYFGFETDTGEKFILENTNKEYFGRVILMMPTSTSRRLVAFKIENLSWDEQISVNILSNYNRYGKFYNGEILKKVDYAYNAISPFPETFQLNQDRIADILGQNINWNSSYLISSKIAVLNSAYPELMKIIVPQNLSSVPSDVASGALKTLTSQELILKYLAFLNGVKQIKDNCASIMDNLTENSIDTQIETCVTLLSDLEIKNIPIEKKLLAISIMLENWTVTDKQETQLIRLIKFTKDNEVDDLLIGLNSKSKISSVDYNLLRRLVYKTDNDHTYFHEDNYKHLINVLAELNVNKSNTFKSKLNNLSVDELIERNIKYYYKSFWNLVGGDLTLLLSFMNGESLYSYDTKAEWYSNSDDNSDISIYTNTYLGNDIIDSSTPLRLDAFSPIYFTNKSGLSMLSEYNTDKPLLSPAIVAFYASDIGNTKLVVDGIQATVDVASLASGYGALVKGPSLARKAFIIADMVGSGVSLTTNIVGYENLSPSAKAFVDALNILTAGIAITDLASAVNLRTIFSRAKTLNKPLPSKNQVKLFLQKLKNAENDLGSIPADKIKEAKVWIAHLEAEVKLGNIDDIANDIADAKRILKNLESVSITTLLAKPRFATLRTKLQNSGLENVFKQDFANASESLLEDIMNNEQLFNTWKNFRNKYPNKAFCN